MYELKAFENFEHALRHGMRMRIIMMHFDHDSKTLPSEPLLVGSPLLIH